MKKLFSLEKLFWAVAVFSSVAFFAWILATKKPPAPVVHWHAPISYEICGEPFSPPERENHGLVHGHGDGRAHIEGRLSEPSNTTLGKFMDAIGVPFSKTQFSKYKNGEKCPGKNRAAKVRVFVDGAENFQFRDLPLRDAENIKITFE